MSFESALNFVPAFVLVFFRLAGMFLSAPLFGSARIPRRVKVMLSLALAAAVAPIVPAVNMLPQSPWQLAVGIGSEMIFG